MFCSKTVILIFCIFTLANCSVILAADHSCSEGQHWVRAHKRREYYRADGTFVNATNVASHCQANPEGYIYWAPRLKNGGPFGWIYKKENSKDWTVEERELVLEALNEVPEILRGTSTRGIFRKDKSELGKDNLATSAKGIIVLYDSAFLRPSPTRSLTRILVHELAHEYYRNLDEGQANNYREAAGWLSLSFREEREGPWIATKSKFVEPDGIVAPQEDFANNIEYFLFNPTKLRLNSPDAYEWIQHHLGDKLKLGKWAKDNK